jgi:hypothetical protein
MSANDLSQRLYSMHVSTVEQIQALAKNPREEVHDAGKIMFEGGFNMSDPKVARDFQQHKDDIDTWLGNRGRVLYTNDVMEKGKYVTKVSDEIEKCNAARPTKKIFAESVCEYMQKAAESDAHKTQALLRVRCEKLGMPVQRSAPDPKKWNAPPPAPAMKPKTRPVFGGVKVM